MYLLRSDHDQIVADKDKQIMELKDDKKDLKRQLEQKEQRINQLEQQVKEERIKGETNTMKMFQQIYESCKDDELRMRLQKLAKQSYNNSVIDNDSQKQFSSTNSSQQESDVDMNNGTEDDIITKRCNFCDDVLDINLVEHWRRCELRQRFNDIVNKVGKDWKPTITQLVDFSDHITQHTEFQHMFVDFEKATQSPETIFEDIRDKQHQVKEIESLKQDLIAAGKSIKASGISAKFQGYNQRVTKENKEQQVKLEKIERLLQGNLNGYDQLAPTIKKLQFWKDNSHLLSTFIENMKQNKSDLSVKMKFDKNLQEMQQFKKEILLVDNFIDIYLYQTDSIEVIEQKLKLAPGTLNHVPFVINDDGIIMTSWLPSGVGTTIYSNKEEEPNWNGYKIVDQLNFESGTAAKQLGSLKPCPDVMYDRLGQDKYEHKIKQQFNIMRLKESKTLGKRKQEKDKVIFMEKLKPEAQRKRDTKRPIKLTPLQEQQREVYSANIITKLLKSYKDNVVELKTIFGSFKDRHTPNPFKFVSKLFCDGISLTDKVLPDRELESFFAERNIHIYLVQKSWTTRKNKQLQDEGKKPKKYFIRLRDENAFIDQQFLTNLAKAMKDLRIKAKEMKVKNRRSIKSNDELTEEELKQIEDEVNSIYLTKFDSTKDFQGCIYVDNVKVAVTKLQEVLQCQKSVYKSSNSCLQLEFNNNRLKLYCKDIHLLSSTSTTKKISIGMKPIFASRVFREKLEKCNLTCMSRIEHSTTLDSVEEEQEFLLNSASSQLLDDKLTSIIAQINSNEELLSLLNCNISRQELWGMFFSSIRNVIIMKYRKQCVVVYAYSDTYKKYIGTLADSSLTTKELAAKFGIPMNNCHLIDITSEGNYSETVLKKLSEKIQILVDPFSFHTDLQVLIDIGIDIKRFGFCQQVKVSGVQFEQVGEMKQFIQENEWDSEAAKSIPCREIEASYSQHKAEIKKYDEMSNSSLVHGFRNANGKLIMYSYSDEIKYQLKQTTEEFVFLEKLLVEKEQSRINGMYIFTAGVTKIEVTDMLLLATSQFNQYQLNNHQRQLELEREKLIQKQQEADRKTHQRKRKPASTYIDICQDVQNQISQGNNEQLHNFEDMQAYEEEEQTQIDTNTSEKKKQLREELEEIEVEVNGKTSIVFEGQTFISGSPTKQYLPFYARTKQKRIPYAFKILKRGERYFKDLV